MNTSLGVFYALSAAASYGLMSYLVHWNPSVFPPGEMIFFRGALTLLILVPFHFRELSKYFRSDSKFLWIRSLTGAVGVLCYFYILQGTVSANANFIYSSSPVFVSVMAWIFFRERITLREFVGIALVVIANVLLYLPNRTTVQPWVWIVGFTGAFCASFAFLSIGAAIKKYSSSLIVIGFAAASMVLAWLYPGAEWKSINPSEFVFLFIVGILGIISQLAATQSFAYLKSPVATTLGRTSLLFSGLLDIFAAGYRPHALEWTSYLVVLLGVYLAVSRKKPVAVKMNV